jgi:hypothetical protein
MFHCELACDILAVNLLEIQSAFASLIGPSIEVKYSLSHLTASHGQSIEPKSPLIGSWDRISLSFLFITIANGGTGRESSPMCWTITFFPRLNIFRIHQDEYGCGDQTS